MANTRFQQNFFQQETDGSDLILTLPDWLPEPVVNAWQILNEWPIIAALVIVIVGYVVSRIIVGVVLKAVGRIASKTKSKLDDRLTELLRRPIFLSVFFSALSVATQSLGLPGNYGAITIKILYTILILVWLRAGFPIFELLLNALGSDDRRFKIVEERTIPLFQIVSKLLLIAFASYVLLGIWGINATAWLASAGVVGIAVGFAAKDTLANLFSGFFIVADAPYKIGDYVNLDTGERGKVTHVGIRSTRLITRDDVEITMPNSLIANGKIINESGGPWEKERIRIKVGVAYGSDVDQVCDILKAIAVSHEEICIHPEPRVRMRGFGASSLDFELLCWIERPEVRGFLSHQIYMEVYKAFNEADIEIPYTKQDIYVKELPN
ncbi:MAG: mechanosensitive ion channel family protein [Pseudomonadota bacterium]